jgi:DNA-binding MarR family transcriptional regulator
MRLTHRQCDFLRKLLDLYHDARQPIHYSQVAEALGVNRFSAYDMLKLLEQKGYVSSQYVLGPERNGPGRSSIAFAPTAKARAAVRMLAGRPPQSAEWQAVRERILAQLRDHGADDDALLHVLLSSIPNIKAPLEYCAETAAALVLNLEAIRNRAADYSLVKALLALAPSGHLGLDALAGLSIGSALAQGFDRSVLDRLLSLTRRFQSHLSTLSDEHLRNLSELVDEALEMIGQSSIASTR